MRGQGLGYGLIKTLRIFFFLLLFLVIVFGCDVFFNMPLHPNPALFTYQLVNVPVQVMYLGPGKLVKVTYDLDYGFENTY